MKADLSTKPPTGIVKPSAFRAPRWLANAHAQTIFASRLRHRPKLKLRRERLSLPDGDFADVDWSGPAERPIVILLHGLEGSSHSPYIVGLMAALEAKGLCAALLHFRGCSGEPNRLSIGYHSGFTRDLDHFVALLRRRHPGRPLAAVGYSLGGNVLLKWLGEAQWQAELATALAVSVPFDLAAASHALDAGFARVYRQALLGDMKRSIRRKFKRVSAPFALPRLASLRTFYAFDEQITAPLHGFAGAADYYRRCSSRQFLKTIRVPTLILHARDDPLLSPVAIPGADELSSQVVLELSEHGGHVGFVGGTPRHPVYWLEHRIPEHLVMYLSCDAKERNRG
jgi:predicted alpha/beta-fold hydrolase